MPGERDQAVVDFMQAVMSALGVDGHSRLQDALVESGIMRASQTRQLGRWIHGETAPGFHTTIALLRAAGMLRDARAEPGEAASQNEGEALPQLVRRQPGAGQVEEAMLTVLAELRALLPELRALTEAQEQPREAARQEGTLS